MSPDATGLLDEAYGRLHATGPEFEGWLSNHGPMAAEAMARHGHAEDVAPWLDGYMHKLEEFPRGSGAVGADWREALGNPRRIADWTVFFVREVSEQSWRQVLATWWPRLLPGVAASATHGIIRVGHAVRALLTDGDDPVHATELAHALAYWAARWQPVPGIQYGQPVTASADLVRQAPGLTPAAALAAVPRIADQTGGFRERLPRLVPMPGWPVLLPSPATRSPEENRAWLAGLADAAVSSYRQYGHGAHCHSPSAARTRREPLGAKRGGGLGCLRGAYGDLRSTRVRACA